MKEVIEEDEVDEARKSRRKTSSIRSPSTSESIAAPAMLSSAASAAAAERKKELRRLVKKISEEDDDQTVTYDKAAAALSALRDLKVGPKERKKGDRIHPLAIPEHFLCPISGEIMRDPVVLASGQTCDRAFIQERLNSGNRTCPKTQEVLTNTILIPNHLVQSMISEWCKENGVNLSPLGNQDEGLVTKNERDTFDELLGKISSPSPAIERRQAIRELRLLTKRNRSFRAVIGEKPNAIPQLLSVLSIPSLTEDPQVQEDTVTTILNLSIHDNNKKIIGDSPQVIPFLIDSLKSGTMETRSNSAAALFSLSAFDSNKVKICQMGAMKPLVDLLEHGSPTAKKDAATAIFNLCMAHVNKATAVRDGAVVVALKAIADRSLVDESLTILAFLSSDQDAAEKISENDGVACLLSIIRDNPNSRNKENAAVVLYSICMYDRSILKEVREEEDSKGTISWLAQNGTSRARRKAAGILERLKQTMSSTYHSY
ncbi:U-box domain-containing protein 9-like [Typha angustifolia]|uniref:U-box domain-containing protein 9-like n=1 Tax=Typha angustifolia TaxID=59011 RepID=UPI003C2E64DF